MAAHGRRPDERFRANFNGVEPKTDASACLFNGGMLERAFMTRPHDAGMEAPKANRERRMPLLSKAEASGLTVLDSPTRRSGPNRPRRTHQLASIGPTARQHLKAPGTPRVRLLMSVAEAERLADLLSARIPAKDEQRLLDQLWLRTVLIEQRRRVRRDERAAFVIRADRMLKAFDL